MSLYQSLALKGGKERSLQRFHPWVFSGALQNEIKKTAEGEIVRITDSKGNFLATGYVQHGSIAVRILSFIDEAIDVNFWIRKIENCYEIRRALGFVNNAETNCYRLMHGEGDGVSGLIIDFYNGTAVIQCHTSGIYKHLPLITEALVHVLKDDLKAVFNKSSETLHGAVEEASNGFVFGDGSATNLVKENGFQFKVDWQTGQKTGFFLDQRDNRALLGHYSKGKDVLNTFAYTGGFSVYALMNGAKQVDSVDVSKNAITLLNENMLLNNSQADNFNSEAIDTFSYFKLHDKLYDLLILDPPAFAKNIGAKHNALMGYKRLNIEGFKKVKPGGLMFTFSCSQVVDSHTFNQTILSAAIESNRKVKVIHRLTQPADHPVNIFHPEGEYLKGLVLFVE
ncbi:MAG: class I SAM-dependent rRNA methyltransferase [Bacteroidota bacterium]|nr:class I SAM-dependent rRNA methyltransferase [Bacteroidota bacterium]